MMVTARVVKLPLRGGRSTNKGSACKSSARTWTTSLSLPQARVSFAFFTTLFREIWARFERKSAKFGPFSPKFRCERNLGAFQTKLWPRAITVSKTPVYYESVQLACTSSQFAEILLETPQEHFSACWRWRRWRPPSGLRQRYVWVGLYERRVCRIVCALHRVSVQLC